ncbi:ABC transporter ATP-binding protein [Moorella naiadis]|uniref:ABC transporter ATP-binding protein n=1 Tax=Moorella naiadis (nom. illeg.) TaxID=3093670 RepID=UPI003D9C87A3
MATVSLEKVRKSYGPVTAVDGINLDIADGNLVTLLGPSGCGKTTTLRIIAGLIMEDSGVVKIDNVSVRGIPPWKRDVGMVFQNYALFPHLTVWENIAYGLRIRKWRLEQISKQIDKVASLMEIGLLLKRLPRELSGGQQQRVALARALAINPRVLLMDEPLSGLDAKLRERVRYELRQLQKAANITTIYVTHDQEEAFALADRIVVMNAGHIEQVGTPSEMYREPETSFVARFLGTSNVFTGTVLESDPSSNKVVIGYEKIRLSVPYKDGVQRNQKVEVVIRTNKISLVPAKPVINENCFEGRALGLTFNGSYWKVAFVSAGLEFKADVPADRDVSWVMPGKELWASVTDQEVLYFAQ